MKLRLYSPRKGYELCFILDVDSEFTDAHLDTLNRVYFSHHGLFGVSKDPMIVLEGQRVIEIRPIPDYPSPSSSKALKQFENIGITSVLRCEEAKRYFVDTKISMINFLATIPTFDSMQQRAYEGEDIFAEETGSSYIEFPKEIQIMTIPKPQAIANLMKLGMKEPAAEYWYTYFSEKEKRNPLILEIMTIVYGYTEHSKHPHFTGVHVIDGIEYPSLMSIVKASYLKNPGRSVIAFDDNASTVLGHTVPHLAPISQGGPYPFAYFPVPMDTIFKAETHNFPTTISPYPGAATGIGGLMRDVQINGQGGNLLGSFNILGVGALGLEGV